MDESLLRRVDAAASKLGVSRSAYLSRLAARDTRAAHGPGRSPSVRNALSRLDRLFADVPSGTDSTAVIREMRDARADRWPR